MRALYNSHQHHSSNASPSRPTYFPFSILGSWLKRLRSLTFDWRACPSHLYWIFCRNGTSPNSYTYIYNIGKCSAQRAPPIFYCVLLSCRLAMQIMCSDAALFVWERASACIWRRATRVCPLWAACTLRGIKCWGRREHDLISEALIVKFVGRSDAAAAPYTLPSQFIWQSTLVSLT
jgi:hypothetical protein